MDILRNHLHNGLPKLPKGNQIQILFKDNLKQTLLKRNLWLSLFIGETYLY